MADNIVDPVAAVADGTVTAEAATSASDTYKFKNLTGKIILLINNTTGGDVTLTIYRYAALEPGGSVSNRTVTVAAGTKKAFRLDPSIYTDPTSGLSRFAVTGGSGVKYELLRL